MPKTKESRKSQPLSQEYIYDSDDDGAEEIQPVPVKVSSKIKKSTSQQKPKRRKVTPPKTPTPPPPPSSSESEEEDGEDIEDAIEAVSSSTEKGRNGATADKQGDESSPTGTKSRLKPSEKVSKLRYDNLECPSFKRLTVG